MALMLEVRRRQQNIGRLQVAMHQPAGVRRLDRPGQDPNQPDRGADRFGLPIRPGHQRPARDVLERQIRGTAAVADLEDLDDVRVMEPGHRLGLRQQPTDATGPGTQHFQGDDSVQGLVPGTVDDAGRPPADLAEDRIAGHIRAVRRQLPVGRRLGGLQERVGRPRGRRGHGDLRSIPVTRLDRRLGPTDGVSHRPADAKGTRRVDRSAARAAAESRDTRAIPVSTRRSHVLVHRCNLPDRCDKNMLQWS